MRKNGKKALTILRRVSQGAMLALIVGGASLRNAGVDAIARYLPELQGLCPFGATTTLGRVIADPAAAFDPHRANTWILLGLLLVTVLGGAVFCGWLCPLGTVQEWLGRLGRRLLGKRYDTFVSSAWSRRLGFLRYVMLALVLLSAVGWLALPLDNLNPSYALAHAWTQALPWTAIALLLVILVASLFIERPWCRFLCPLGGLVSIVGRIGILRPRRDPAACVSCGACTRACPARIDVASAGAVRSDRCTSCLACVASCPVPGALSFTAARRPLGKPGAAPAGARKAARKVPAAAAMVLLFFAPLAIARLAGWYLPAGGKTALFAAAGKGPSTGTTKGPDRAGAVDLSPRMSLAQTAEVLGLESAELLDRLGLPPAYDLGTVLMDIELDEEHEDLSFGRIRERLEGFSSVSRLD